MATLTNTQISVTYVGLLKTSASTVLSSTAQQITDGSGNNSVLFLSTAGVGIGGAPSSGIEFEVTGNAKITGDLIVDNLTLDASTITSSGTENITLDSGGAIILDAESGGINLNDSGTTIGGFTLSSNDFEIRSIQNDKDIIFKGLDGSSAVTALTLDMSDAGKALFNSGATFGGSITSNSGIVIDNITIDGTEIDLSSGDLTLDVAGDIILDAGGGDISLKDDGTDFGSLTNSSGNLIIKSGTTTMLTGSGANATFAGNVIVNGTYLTVGNQGFIRSDDSGYLHFQGGTTGTRFFNNANNTALFTILNNGNSTFAGTISATGSTLSGVLDVTATVSDAVFLRSSQATTTNVYITNTNATANNTANLYFAPANNIGGAYIRSTAIEDFSSSANRTADLRFAVRKDGTFSDALIIDSSGKLGVGVSPVAKLHVSGDTGGTDSIARFQNTNSAKVTRLQLSDNAGTVGDVLIAYDHSDASSANHFVGMGVNNNTAFKIDNNDNITLGAATSLAFDVADFAQITFKESGAITIDSDNDQSSRNFQIKDGSGSSLLTVLDTGDSTFAGSTTIRKSALGGSTAMSDGTIILGAGSTNYYSLRLDSSADLHLDRSFGGSNSTVLTVDRSSSNIGISANDPVKTLDVRGQLAISNNASSYWYIDREDSTGNFQIIDDGDKPALTIDTSRRVMINQTSNITGQALQVNGFIDITKSTSHAIRFFDNTTFRGGLGLDSWATGGSASDITMFCEGEFGIVTGGGTTKKISIGSNGEMTLTCGQSTIATFKSTGSGQNEKQLLIGTGGDRAILTAQTTAGATTAMAFNTGSAERMRITDDGSVLIGTTSNQGVGGVSIDPNLSSLNTLTTIVNNTSVSNAEMQTFRHSGSQVGSITLNGSTGTNFNTTSDYRLKENIVEMTGALDRVSQLKPSRFNFIAKADKTVDGFLAHEVQEIVPEAITGVKDAVDEKGNPKYQGIDQSKLVPLLVGAIQELKKEIEILKNK